MAKKKKTNQQQKAVKPEDYIRKNARRLPVYKCYKAVGAFDEGMLSIVVVRQHPQGSFTFAGYLLDNWCLGVKDTFWRFNVGNQELEELFSLFKERQNPLEEIEYVEAHNWVYGALEFADEAGIKPCKDFGLTKYILEEDDNNVELIEYDFGRDGEYFLVAKDHKEAMKYIPILDKNIGKDNYRWVLRLSDGYEDYDDEDDYDDDEDYDEDEENLMNFKYPFEITPMMEYTYKGKDYPKEINLHYPDVETIVKKETEEITDDDIEKVLSLPADYVRDDLQNLILREMGLQWGKTKNELEDANNYLIVGNALMFLTKFAIVDETLPVVLEVMRQSEAFEDFNFGDIPEKLLGPVLCILVKDNPRLLTPFLLEPGLFYSFKMFVLELLCHIAQHCPEMRQEIIDMTVELLSKYKEDLPNRTICDGTITAFAISILVGVGAVEQLPLIEELYATGLVDESCEGHIEGVRETIQNPHVIFDLPPMDPYSIRDEYIKFISRQNMR